MELSPVCVIAAFSILWRCRPGQVVEGDELAAIWQEQRQDMRPIAGPLPELPVTVLLFR
jgi:hypothetical protein